MDKSAPNSDRTFLVTIYNISSIQTHTTFRTPINSTTIHVITQVKFCLIEKNTNLILSVVFS